MGDKPSDEELKGLFTDLLRCIAYRIKLDLGKSDDKYFNVSLITFTHSNGTRASVTARSNPQRNLVESIKSKETISYYVAKYQRLKIVQDFTPHTIFPFKGLSTPDAPYRSILFLPLPPITLNPEKPDSRSICQGVVTIDSEAPYEFWSVTDTAIEIQMSPFLQVIKMALSAQKTGVPIKS